MNAGTNVTLVLVGLSVVPYLLVVAGLVFGGRHFRRRNDEVGQA